MYGSVRGAAGNSGPYRDSHCLVVDGPLVVHAGVASIQGQGDVPLTRPMFHFRTDCHA